MSSKSSKNGGEAKSGGLFSKLERKPWKGIKARQADQALAYIQSSASRESVPPPLIPSEPTEFEEQAPDAAAAAAAVVVELENENDPVKMMLCLKEMRRKLGKTTKRAVEGTKSMTGVNRQGFAGYDEEAAAAPPHVIFARETDPLIYNEQESITETPTRAKALWQKLRDSRNAFVFDQSESELDTSRSIKEEIRSGVEFNTTHCFAAIVVYLIVAVLAYSYVFEHWSVIDSIYFACVSFTTIGYGDLTPTSDASRLFTACFALTGIVSLGIALGVLGSNLLEAEAQTVDHARELSMYQVMSLFDSPSQAALDAEIIPQESASGGKRQSCLGSSFVTTVVPLFSLLLVFCWLLGNESDWDVVQTFYYCIITATTVGYGDMTPQTQTARLFAVPVILLGVMFMGQWLSRISSAIIERRQAQFRKRFQTRQLTVRDLETMDANGDGKVTLAEYLSFMLVAMNKVDQELLDELAGQFNRLDVDGTGSLEKEDLITVAMQKLRCTQRKLELSLYKQQLLQANGNFLGQSKWSAHISAVQSQI